MFTNLDVMLESTTVFVAQMLQSLIPITSTPTEAANEMTAFYYIVGTGALGMVCVGLSFFFEYKFEGIVGHHYPKSLSVSFDSRA